MPKRALITGITGQDGAYLARYLLGKGYKVIGAVRRNSNRSTSRLMELGIQSDIEFVDFELNEYSNIQRVLERIQPDEFYNLAAQSFVSASWEQPIYTADSNAMGVARILEAMRQLRLTTRYYQASTSEMYGKVQTASQNEQTAFHPRSPYGVSKVFSHFLTVNYRESFGLHASSGILFNHESPLRGMNYVTRKITLSLARILQGQLDVLELGNIEAKRDWGFAEEYVQGMWLMLQREVADDYVLATGKTSSIRSFVDEACKALDIAVEWEGEGKNARAIDKRSGRVLVKVNPKYFRPADVDMVRGDASKARSVLGWEPKVELPELAEMMAIADFDRVKRGAVLF
jgi:GDPmannose 4,6-dehydratase